ncbi:MAG: hypothetical protein SR1Q5_06820 [Quinella sp. 1Q5]|nr:hypothetical protein [Quinella sp. 1Q5]
MKVKKFLAVLVIVGAIIFGQATSEACDFVGTTNPSFTFAAENFSLNSNDKFQYVTVMAKWRCTECGKIVLLPSKQHPANVGYAGPCPNSGIIIHVWKLEGLVET